MRNIRLCEDYPMDEVEARKALDFFAEMVHIKGPLGGQKLVLEPWQRTIVREIFGRKRHDGTRLYRTVYIEVPRKNGKSYLCAGIALYLLFCDGESGAEIYSVAGTRDQALMVYEPAVAIINKTSWLKSRCKPYKALKRVNFRDSYYKAIAADADSAHGFNPHGIIFDELHVQPDRELWDTMQTGCGSRQQPLTVAITTAGYDRSSICWEQHEIACRILDENDDYEDETFLPVVYSADPADPIDDPKTWAKANPNLGVSVYETYLREQAKKALESSAYENTFRRLHLNQWTEQDVRWMPMDAWDNGSQSFDVDDLTGEPCFVGIDLATSRDLTAMVLVFPRDDGTYIVVPYFWCPADAASRRDEQDKRSYKGWIPKYITTTPGTATDRETIRKTLMRLADQYDIICVGADPWNMEETYQQMIRDGWPEEKWVEYRQGFASYNEPMKKCLELVREGKLIHGGNPVLRWNASNVVAKEDPSGNLRPDKGKSQDKIDGFCAMLMALGLALRDESTQSAYSSDRGLLSF